MNANVVGWQHAISKESDVKKALKEILKQAGVIAFLCSVMVLSAPNINPDFDQWLVALVTTRAGIADEAANLLLIVVPAIIGAVGLVANVGW
jgi:hypothetical protein